MKKIFLCMFMCMLLFTMTSYASESDTKSTLSYDAAVAYKSVIDETVEKYGVYCGDYSNPDFYTGFGLAHLIDFDGNGTLELVIGCGTHDIGNQLFYEVYGYDDGLIKYAHTYACDSMQLAFDMSLMTHDNNIYAVTNTSSICDGTTYYGTIEDNKWVVTELYSHDAGWCDGSWHPQLYNRDVNQLNGNDITEEEYSDIMNKFKEYPIDTISDYYHYGEKGAELVIKELNNVIESHNAVKVTLDGSEIYFDQPPVIVTGRTLVPVRAVVEKMGGTVEWNQDTQTALLKYNDKVIELTIDSKVALLNGEEHYLDVEPQIINSRTLMPIRFIAENFGFDVEWDNDTNTVIITS